MPDAAALQLMDDADMPVLESMQHFVGAGHVRGTIQDLPNTSHAAAKVPSNAAAKVGSVEPCFIRMVISSAHCMCFQFL